MKIAVAITVHNRHDTATETVKQWKKCLPKGAKLYIVDDGSDVPFPNADIRNEKPKGIAGAKNDCLSLCDGADYIFLVDDDVYPKVKDWHLPYINTGLNHLCFTFDHFCNGNPNGRRKIKTENGIVHWFEPCGLVLFFTKKCLEVVGGMDERYGAWGYEHLQLSARIHNAALTPYPFMDIENSLDLFHSLDYEQTVTRSVDASVRMKLANINKRKYMQDRHSKAFIPYKRATGKILTTYLTGSVDPQRGQKWTADIEQVRVLADSCAMHNVDLVVINNCFTNEQAKEVGFTNKLPWVAHNNPYFQRWYEYRDYLKLNPTDNVFLTDCNDVELLREPFKNIQPNKLYVGWERDFIGCQWMRNHHKTNFSQTFIACNTKTPLLNAGVIGGRYDIVMEFLNRICDMIGILPEIDKDDTDMSTFNWVLYSHFNGRFLANDNVTTVFKAYTDNGKAIFRHK